MQIIYEGKGKVNSLSPEDEKCQNLSGNRSTGHGRGAPLNLSPSVSLMLFYLDLRTAKVS